MVLHLLPQFLLYALAVGDVPAEHADADDRACTNDGIQGRLVGNRPPLEVVHEIGGHALPGEARA